MSATIRIYRPPYLLARTVRRCTTCKRRRRFLVRLFEWYPAQWICGGCGYVFVSGEGRSQSSRKRREKHRQYVREKWPRVGRLAEVVKRLCVERIEERTKQLLER